MSEQANTIAAAEVSSEYLSDIRLRVRSSVDKLDGEIKDLILAARADLVRGGVLPARAADETEEEMRAVFVELCSADSYDLHTVWFYGLPSDVEDVGSFSVGMLEEKSRGAEPVFTPCTYDADTIAALRERGAEIEQSDEARSIPRPSIQQEALVEENRFYPVDGAIFTTAANENGLADTPFWVRGEIVSRSDVGGYDTIQLSTEYGALYISAVSVNIPEIDEGAEITVYFVYSGFSDALDGPCGVYAYHE